MGIAIVRFYEELNDYLPKIYHKKEINYTLPIDLFIQTILEVIYQPDGLGYLEAKKDFENLISQYN